MAMLMRVLKGMPSVAAVMVIAPAVIAMSCRSATSPIAAEQVRLQTERSTYAPADTVLIEVQNTGAEPVKFSACSVELQVRLNSAWKAVSDDWTCVSILQRLNPGDVTPVWLDLPATVASSVYRFYFPQIYDDAEKPLAVDQRVSNEFVVSAGQ